MYVEMSNPDSVQRRQFSSSYANRNFLACVERQIARDAVRARCQGIFVDISDYPSYGIIARRRGERSHRILQAIRLLISVVRVGHPVHAGP